MSSLWNLVIFLLLLLFSILVIFFFFVFVSILLLFIIIFVLLSKQKTPSEHYNFFTAYCSYLLFSQCLQPFKWLLTPSFYLDWLVAMYFSGSELGSGRIRTILLNPDRYKFQSNEKFMKYTFPGNFDMVNMCIKY
jgi:hypothetical protein